MTTTKEPVTVSGWYENTDGTWSEYVWGSRGSVTMPVEIQRADRPPTPDERDVHWTRGEP